MKNFSWASYLIKVDKGGTRMLEAPVENEKILLFDISLKPLSLTKV